MKEDILKFMQVCEKKEFQVENYVFIARKWSKAKVTKYEICRCLQGLLLSLSAEIWPTMFDH
jgi:hypothetical protein